MLLKEAALPSPENENYACRQYIFEQFSLEVVGKSSSTEEILSAAWFRISHF